jgi:hypothetical protein
MAWSPVNFWPHVPGAFRFVQFPFRLLAFATTFAALLQAIAVWFWLGRRGQVPTWIVPVSMLLIGLTAAFHRPTTPLAFPRRAGDATPISLRLPSTDYMLTPDAGGPPDAYALQTALAQPGADGRARATVTLAEPTRVVLPLLYYPKMVRVLLDGIPIPYDGERGYVAVSLPVGTYQLTAWFAGDPRANVVSAIAWVFVAIAIVRVCVMRVRRRLRSPAMLNRSELRTTFVALAAFAAGLLTPGIVTWVRDAIVPFATAK